MSVLSDLARRINRKTSPNIAAWADEATRRIDALDADLNEISDAVHRDLANLEARVYALEQPAPPPTNPPLRTITGKGISIPGQSVSSDWAYELDVAKDAGAGFVRLDVGFDTSGAHDPIVEGILSRGMVPFLCVGGSTGPGANPAVHCYMTAAHYAALGARHFELFNEPNLPSPPRWTPEQYAPMFEAASSSLRTIADVVLYAGALGSLVVGEALAWTKQALAAGLKSFDAYTTHCYYSPTLHGEWVQYDLTFGATTGPYAGTNNIRGVLDTNGHKDKPIINSEAGCAYPNEYGYDQATAIKNALADKRAAATAVYTISTYTGQGASEIGKYNLLNADRSPRPGLAAFKAAA